MKGTVEFDGIVSATEYAQHIENMSLLEQEIFGYLAENQKSNQHAYTAFLVNEFNSHIDESGNGKRYGGESQFIKRYFPQHHP